MTHPVAKSDVSVRRGSIEKFESKRFMGSSQPVGAFAFVRRVGRNAKAIHATNGYTDVGSPILGPDAQAAAGATVDVVTLGARLMLAFSVLALMTTALVGIPVRMRVRGQIEAQSAARIDSAVVGAHRVLEHEARELRGLLTPLCEHDTIVDRVHLELERIHGETARIGEDQRLRWSLLVREQAEANRLDELVLALADGTLVASSRPSRLGFRDERIAAALAQAGSASPRLHDEGGDPAMEIACVTSAQGVRLGLVGTRRLAPLLEWVGRSFSVELSTPALESARLGPDVLERDLPLPEVEGLRVVVRAKRDTAALDEVDRSIAATGAVALLVACLIAAVLARSLANPIVALSRATRSVLQGQPNEVHASGGREVTELATTFNETLRELAAMRRRLAVTERMAARREVARRVAHEIKNPLAPIRAAVETLQRLRARNDAAFDAYFDEATQAVLSEVRRISDIVRLFTELHRFPPPTIQAVDLAALARRVTSLHGSSPLASGCSGSVELMAEGAIEVRADPDQWVQLLTNLVQNGLEAAGETRSDPRVVVTLEPPSDGRVRVLVRDNGPGVSEAMLPRLFEPYATTKASGTGLGLAIVQRIVFEHGGEISYRTGTKGGAIFEILLPVAGPSLLDQPMDATGPRDEPIRQASPDTPTS
jgi:signal transduction histidine kinase